MRRREFHKHLAAATAFIFSPLPLLRPARAAGGATPVFTYANFSSPTNLNLQNAAGIHTDTGTGILYLLDNQGHNHGGVWYKDAQTGPFTTVFTFKISGLGTGVTQSGMTFVMQSVGSDIGGGDANMCGYSGATSQMPPYDSIAIKFDAGNASAGQGYPAGGLPASTGMYINGGPAPQGGHSIGLVPFNDLNPSGISFYDSATFEATIVYDGSLLTMVLLDMTSGKQARFAWPLNLANSTNPTGNYVGLSAGTAAQGIIQIFSWSYSTGYNARLATPVLTPPPGQYAGTQTVAIHCPPGSTCYYTTNGLLPTSASTKYTGPITVSANEVVQAVAIQSGFTDSLVATGAYQINTPNIINYPNGFSAGNLVNVGFAYLSNSTYRVSDDTTGCAGAVWFPAPVAVSSFSTTFTLEWDKLGQGMCFVIQNSQPAYTSPANSNPAVKSTQIGWSGGTTVVGADGNAMGYAGLDSANEVPGQGDGFGILSSVAIAFDQYFVANSVGLYTNGNSPQGNQTAAAGIKFSGAPVTCTLTYNGTTLTISLAQGSAQFSHSWPIDIPTTVGGSTAYVGFTGGTGGAASIAAINSWTFNAPPGTTAKRVPSAPTNLKAQ